MIERDGQQQGESGFEGFFARAAKAAGLTSQTELAALLGVHRSAVTQAKRKDGVPKAWVLAVSRRTGADPDWLEFGRERPGAAGAARGALAGNRTRPAEADETQAVFAAVPKVRTRLSAGGGSFETGGEVEQFYPFRQDWLRAKGQPAQMVLMDVVGNSMEPEIRHGDMVLIDQGQVAVVAHGVYAVGLEDTVLVKRVEKRPGQLVLLSDNRDYAPIVLAGDELEALRVIGRVLWVGREL
ncbi:LexA family transcriptional regulator [Desulfovibrio sp. TomC]|uniref:LexA family transcriptional regulator n=1 Tax=Desulfovibrio sp. TomC TaxID=1562888 RepID=UPI0005BB865C|nr:S24 family peptidase [Desulfovibrio sp. TomC]